MFCDCSCLVSVVVGDGWDVSNVVDMGGLFNYCTNLNTLNISNWDTGSVQEMNSMFAFCENLESLDLTNWDVSSVNNMQFMFKNCILWKVIIYIYAFFNIPPFDSEDAKVIRIGGYAKKGAASF